LIQAEADSSDSAHIPGITRSVGHWKSTVSVHGLSLANFENTFDQQSIASWAHKIEEFKSR